MGDKLGPFLWQLPPNLEFDAQKVADFCALLPRTVTAAVTLAQSRDDKLAEDRVLLPAASARPLRHCVEARHASFASDDAVELLRRNDVAFVVADTAGKYPYVETATADFMYARLHGDQELYASGYTDAALDRWAEKIADWTSTGRDVYVYFDNDVKGYAPSDAMKLIERVGR